MGDPLESLPAEALEGETRRLRRLARGLLYAEHDAEDAVQDAWLTLLRPEREAPRSLRAWLAGTVRRLAATGRREDARRARRERSAARPERVAGAGESSGRIEVLRLVLDAVDALEEPYRSTIVMRFLDGLAPREIARRAGVPVNTVRSRVRRGLERLRAELDPEGDPEVDTGREERRRDFLAALAPLAGKAPWETCVLAPSASALARGSGALVMKHQVQLGALAGLFLIGFAGWKALSGGSRAPVEQPVASLEPSPASAGPGIAAPEGVERRREPVAPEAAAARDWVVRGHVTLGNRELLPDVPLLARLHDGTSTAGEVLFEERLASDGEGRFEWALPRPTRFVTLALSAELEDHDTWTEPLPVPAADPSPQDLLVRVYPLDVSIAGRVLDLEHRPVANARVETYHDEARTDAEGRYRLRGTSLRGATQGTVVAPGFRFARFTTPSSGPGEVRADDILLAPGELVRGRVTGAGGEPVPRADISLWNHDEVRTRSDEEGRFELTSLDPDEDDPWLWAVAPGFCDQSRQISPEERERGELEWVLERGARVRGTVRDEDGSPVAGARLVLAYHPDAVVSLTAWSRADGAFEFPLVQPGENTLWAIRGGLGPARLPVVVPPSGEALERLEVVLPPGHVLAGQVVDDAGNAVRWAYVYVRSLGDDQYVPARYADANGRFQVAGLPDGRFMLGFLKESFMRREEPFDPVDRDDLVVRLERSGAIAGRVVDGITGEPVTSFRIRFVAPSNLSGYWVGWAAGGSGVPFTDPDGYWTTERDEELTVGRSTAIQASAPGYAPAVVEGATVTADPDPDALVIRLFASSAPVRGRVVASESGLPIAGARVRPFRGHPPRADDHVELEAVTDAVGRFELEAVPVGSVSLVVDHADWLRALDGPFDVPPAGVVERLVELGLGGRIRGVLLDVEGRPRAGEEMVLEQDDVPGAERRQLETATDDEGRFAFERLMPGSYRVAWFRRSGERQWFAARRAVRVEGSTTTELEFRPLGRTTIHGTASVSAGMSPAIAAHLRPAVWDGEPSAWYPLTQNAIVENGQFLFEGVPAGTYLVQVSNAEAASGQCEVEVPAAGEVEVWVELVGGGKRR